MENSNFLWHFNQVCKCSCSLIYVSDVDKVSQLCLFSFVKVRCPFFTRKACDNLLSDTMKCCVERAHIFFCCILSNHVRATGPSLVAVSTI